MASFAKIGLNSKVIQVVSVHDNELLDSNGVEQENIGIQFLESTTGWALWKKTSYNTYAGEHKLGRTPLRKNHASIGMTYDENRDAFIPKKLYNSWTLNETTCRWDPPVAYPTDGQTYNWNEENQQWDLI